MCGCCWLSWLCPTLTAQTLVHPQAVEIRATGSPAGALSVWGGVKAGANGTVQVINADGSLNVTPTIGAGTITFDKWADNDCAPGEVAQWVDNTSKWECSSLSGIGGLAATDNAVITGAWEFRASTLVGDDTSAQQLLHLYKASSQAGLRIQRGDGTAWDLLANTNLTLQTSTGTLAATFTPQGGFTLGQATQANTINGNTTLSGDLTFNGQLNSHFVPELTDTYDLGSSTNIWRESFISRMNALLFVEQTITLFGGWSVIGKNAGTFYSGVSAGATQIAFGKAMTVGHFIVVRGKEVLGTYATEYWQVGAQVLGSPSYTYQVSRPGGAPGGYGWSEGTPYLVLGALGDGRIELNAYTTPKISILTQGATYNAQTEIVRIGHLDSYYTIPSGKVGLAIGDPAANSLTYYDGVLTIRGNGAGLTSINGGNISTDTVTAAQIATDAITADEIAANAVKASEIEAGAVTAGKLAADLVLATVIRANTRSAYNSGIGFYMSSTGTFGVGNGSEQFYFDGTNIIWNAGNSSIDASGNLTATNVNLTGAITATSGSFTGTVNFGGGAGVADASGLRVNATSATTWTAANSYSFSATGLKAGLTTLWDAAWVAGTKRIVLLENADTTGVSAIESIILHVGDNDYYSMSGATAGNNSIELSRGVSNNDFIRLYSKTGFIQLDGATQILGPMTGSLPGTATALDLAANDNYAELRVLRNSTSSINHDMYIGYGSGASSTLNLYSNNTLTAQVQSGNNLHVYGTITTMGGANATMSTNQWYCNSSYACHFNYSGTGYTYVGNASNPIIMPSNLQVPGVYVTNWVSYASALRSVCTNANAAGDDAYIYYYNGLCNAQSSLRYKQDIVPAREAWARVLDIQPVEFAYRTEPGVRHVGAIAEDVAALGLEGLVIRDAAGQPDGLNYERMALYLLPVVREQRDRIAALEAHLATLTARKD